MQAQQYYNVTRPPMHHHVYGLKLTQPIVLAKNLAASDCATGSDAKRLTLVLTWSSLALRARVPSRSPFLFDNDCREWG